MLALLQQVGIQVPGWLQTAQAVLVGLQSVFIVAGIIAAYYRFIREKPHTFRLQATVSGTAEIHGATIYLLVTATAHNAGKVAIPLNLEDTALRIGTRKAGDDEWRHFDIRDIFLGRYQVRSEEKIEEQVWIEIPYELGRVGVRLELSIVGKDEDCTLWPAYLLYCKSSYRTRCNFIRKRVRFPPAATDAEEESPNGPYREPGYSTAQQGSRKTAG